MCICVVILPETSADIVAQLIAYCVYLRTKRIVGIRSQKTFCSTQETAKCERSQSKLITYDQITEDV